MTENSITIDYTYNINNQLLTETINADTTLTYDYDLNGNLVSKTDGSDTTLYEWDYDNKLTTVHSPLNTVSYEYDGDGNRISKTTGGVTTKYINDVGLPLVQVLFETNDAGEAQTTYTYGNDLIAMNKGGTVSYYHYDGLGSVRQLTDDTEAVVASYTYDAFGNVIAQTTGGGMAYHAPVEEGNPLNKAGIILLACFVSGLGFVTFRSQPVHRIGGRRGVMLILVLSTALITISIPTSTATEADATGNPYGFTGESQFGEGDDLIFLRARYYSPSTGRFISREPIIEPIVQLPNNQVFILVENPFSSSPKVTILKNNIWLVPFLIYNPQILNPYVYSYNNPINWIDDNGLLSAPGGVGAAIMIVGIAAVVISATPVMIAVGLIAIPVGAAVLIVGETIVAHINQNQGDGASCPKDGS